MSHPLSLKALSAPEILLRLLLVLPLGLRLMTWAVGRIQPLHGNLPSEIVSYASMHHLDTRFNYWVFLACGAMTLLLILGSLYGYRRDVLVPLLERCFGAAGPRDRKKQLGWRLSLQYYLGDIRWDGFAQLREVMCSFKGHLGALLANQVLWMALTNAVLIVWILNAEYVPLGGIVRDLFHEGEYLGLAPAILQSHQSFTSVFYIHGWGMDALPELLARSWGWHEHGIAGVRFLRMLESSLAWLGCAWVLSELLRLTRGRSSWAAFTGLLILFLLVRNDFYVLTLRRTVALFQLAGILAFFRCNRGRKMPAYFNALGAILLGASVPLGFLYNYSEASSILILFLLAAGLAVVLERKAMLVFWGGGLCGMGLAGLLLLVWLGPEQVGAMSRQLAYWARYGREIWFTPINLSQQTTAFFWVMVLTQGLAVAHLVISASRAATFKGLLDKEWLVILLLAAALLGNRVGLDRAMEHHLGGGSLSSTFLLMTLGLSWLQKLRAEAGSAPSGGEQRAARILALGAMGLLTGFAVSKGVLKNSNLLDPGLALQHVQETVRQFGTKDEETLPTSYRRALLALGPDVAHSRSFYTLTSEGLWYYLFNKPSSSEFHQLSYARSPQAQGEVIRALQATPPELLLVSSKAQFDLEPRDATPLVYGYALEHYRPYRKVGDCWFWKRAPQALRISDGNRELAVSGSFTEVKEDGVLPAHWLAGSLKLPPQAQGRDSLRLYASQGETGKLVGMSELPLRPTHAAGETAYWKINLPISMPRDRVRVWWYDPPSDHLNPVVS